MTTATKEFLSHLDQLCEERKAAIRAAADTVTVTGTTYYVSDGGDDNSDGLTPETPWQTLSRVSDAELSYGDCIRFKRGDLFRGQVKTKPGVTYAAYGEGEKPRFYGWDKSLCDPALWELYDEAHRIWRLTEPILDCGTIVFNGGETHSRKLIPSYIGGRFVCREDESRLFDVATDMTRDLDMVCFYDERLTEIPTRGESFPIPVIDGESYGELYLRCDGGNPAEVFSEIEALPRRRIFVLACNPDVTVDNLCIKYTGDHAIAGGGQCLKGLTVTNCELGWIGGSIQHYYGTDPNYPEGGRGTVTRYGNAIEIYGGCDGYRVENCYIYQVYDAGITHQISTNGGFYALKNIRYAHNLMERCVYSIEYFLEKNGGDEASYMENCEICHNILRFSGFGWGQQRHNVSTPAHIKGWSYENTARDFSVHHNLFDRAAYRMLHTVARDPESCPTLYGNTYVQTLGGMLGQYGGNREAEPPVIPFDGDTERVLTEEWGEREPTVYGVE